MSTATAELVKVDAPPVTADQLELVRKTVANGASPDELKLYLYDCARQGVHPLDKLLHFTKRGGKYTPVTSIDLMRTRAADTGEYAGSDDAVFMHSSGNETHPEESRVTVYRLVQGQRCAFTATARWSEYYPGDAGGTMWRKMPHTMLAKCAEALALRKGFPRQLAGLYAREELDQAGRDEAGTTPGPRAAIPPSVEGEPENAAVADAGEPATPSPAGTVRLRSVDRKATRNTNVTRYEVITEDGVLYTTIKDQLAAICEQALADGAPVVIESKDTRWGHDLVAVHRAEAGGEAELPPLSADDIPF